jgi:hypothetical protein
MLTPADAPTYKKPTVSGWNLSASRVFPVDDSARVESLSVLLPAREYPRILIIGGLDSDQAAE